MPCLTWLRWLRDYSTARELWTISHGGAPFFYLGYNIGWPSCVLGGPVVFFLFFPFFLFVFRIVRTAIHPLPVPGKIARSREKTRDLGYHLGFTRIPINELPRTQLALVILIAS